MQFFIPAWYSHDDWKENEPVWYRPRKVTEFDDTVKQIQLFSRNRVDVFTILVLGYSPNFRHFLHRQGVLHAPYWSCFDAMQGISEKHAEIFSFHDLSWPEDVEFIYSPFAVIVQRRGNKYAQVEFAEDGNMFCVDMFHNEQLVSRNLYDDRGFMSCQITYRNGKPYREQYFNEQGTWKFARYLDDGHVLMNPQSRWYRLEHEGSARQAEYRQERYNGIEEVIGEVLMEYLKGTAEESVFTAAMHPLHSSVLHSCLKNRPTVLSFFRRRMEEHRMTDVDERLLSDADYIVADKKGTAEIIRNHVQTKGIPVKVITPYDSRVEFGVSQHYHVQNILLAVDQMEQKFFDDVIPLLAEYVTRKNPRARVCLFTRSAGYHEGNRLLQRAEAALKKAGMNPELAREISGVSESRVDDGDSVQAVFSAVQCVDEMAVSRTLRSQRVIADLRALPDQFLQISAMSMGIPQIGMRETDYVADGKNGKIIKDLSALPDALDYYLRDIEHWNQAQIASYDLGGQFTTAQLVQSWKEVIRSVEHQSAAAGK